MVRHMWNKGAQYLRKMGTIILVASVIVWALSHYPVGDSSLTPVQRQEQSYIGRIGKAIEPVLRPLGFDWQIGVSLVSGLAAKEIVVSTMAVLTGSGDNEATLSEKLQNQVYTQGDRAGEKVFTPLKAYTMMVFILLYFHVLQPLQPSIKRLDVVGPFSLCCIQPEWLGSCPLFSTISAVYFFERNGQERGYL